MFPQDCSANELPLFDQTDDNVDPFFTLFSELQKTGKRKRAVPESVFEGQNSLEYREAVLSSQSLFRSFSNALAAKNFPNSEVKKIISFIKPHSHPNRFYWGHQYSWTLTPAKSMQVSIMQGEANLIPRQVLKCLNGKERQLIICQPLAQFIRHELFPFNCRYQ